MINLRFSSITLFWAFYAVTYFSLIKHADLKLYAGHLALIGQSFLDIACIIYAYRLLKNNIGPMRRIFIFWVFSFSFAAVADGSYNFISNILQVSVTSDFVVSIYEIPFLLFLLFQALALNQLIRKEKLFNSIDLSVSRYTFFPFIVIALFILSVFLFGFKWKVEVLSLFWFYHVADTLLEVVGFFLAICCIITSKDKPIFYISTGLLIIIAADFAIRGKVLNRYSISNNAFESIWVLGLLYMAFGFMRFSKINFCDSKLLLLKINNIKPQCAAWLFSIALGSIGFWVLLNEVFFQASDFNYEVMQKVPSILIFISIFIALISNYLTNKLLKPFVRLEYLIKFFLVSKCYEIFLRKRSGIKEFDNLQAFLVQAFFVLRQKIAAEDALAQVALQVAHDIRSPLAALDVAVKYPLDNSENQRVLIRDAVIRIHDIANNLLTKYQKKILKPANHFKNFRHLTRQN